MFVSIAMDPGSQERARELADLLAQYGFQLVQRGLWESMTVSADTLNRIKRDLDRATDANDRLRLFQFPMEGKLVLSSLSEKKWRRMVARDIEPEKAGPALQKTAMPRSVAVQRPIKDRENRAEV